MTEIEPKVIASISGGADAIFILPLGPVVIAQKIVNYLNELYSK